jgi:hypothetical protein
MGPGLWSILLYALLCEGEQGLESAYPTVRNPFYLLDRTVYYVKSTAGVTTWNIGDNPTTGCTITDGLSYISWVCRDSSADRSTWSDTWSCLLPVGTITRQSCSYETTDISDTVTRITVVPSTQFSQRFKTATVRGTRLYPLPTEPYPPIYPARWPTPGEYFQSENHNRMLSYVDTR